MSEVSPHDPVTWKVRTWSWSNPGETRLNSSRLRNSSPAHGGSPLKYRFTCACLFAVLLSNCAAPAPRFSGTVKTEYVSVGSQIGGRVIETLVSAGRTVQHGTIIVRLDPSMLQAQYDEATAQERAASAALKVLEAGTLPSQIEQARGSKAAMNASLTQTIAGGESRIRAATATLDNARANAEMTQRTFDRTYALEQTGDVSKQSLDQARAARDQAWANVHQSQAELNRLIRADLPGETAAAAANAQAARGNYAALINGTKPSQLVQAREQLHNAEAAVTHARARLREATIYSPVAGVVASFNLHPGDMLSANQTAAIIDTFADPYVYIYASQRDLERLRSAKTMLVKSDSGAGTFGATVEAYDRTAQFTPQNVETADQRAELVYGVKLRIHDPQHKLLDGTTVTVELQ